MDGIRVVFEDLPCDVDGFTVGKDEGGETYYTIVINAKLSADRQESAMVHELAHIRRNDFARARQYGVSAVEHEVREYVGR